MKLKKIKHTHMKTKQILVLKVKNEPQITKSQ